MFIIIDWHGKRLCQDGVLRDLVDRKGPEVRRPCEYRHRGHAERRAREYNAKLTPPSDGKDENLHQLRVIEVGRMVNDIDPKVYVGDEVVELHELYINSEEDIAHFVECPKCGNNESMYIDDPRDHFDMFELTDYTPEGMDQRDAYGVYTCHTCGEENIHSILHIRLEM